MIQNKKEQCKAEMEFGDDFGDNSTTFHCQFKKGHLTAHLEKGELEGKIYHITWHTKII